MPITHLTDFSDRLSPMLVKELRQGLRTRGFTVVFLSFQLLLAFILLTAGSAVDVQNAGAVASGVIFTMFIIAVIFIQPMRGVTALSSEITGNTIEMMVLTRLTATRIVLGKWFAIVGQSALILVTIIPYLILRYFYGGMNLLGEIVFLLLIFFTSATLTAVMVGLSGKSTKILRALPFIGFILMLQGFGTMLFAGSGFSGLMSFCSLADWESRSAILAYLTVTAYYGWCALSHGISVIAPVAENHSTARRLVSLGLVLIAAAVSFSGTVDLRIMPFIFGLILAPAVITAITERSILLPPICMPFLKLGLLGRLASLFLLPGWPAGVFYSTLLALISLASVFLVEMPADDFNLERSVAIAGLAVSGGIILAALLSAHFTKDENKRFSTFIIFALVSVALTIIPAILANLDGHEKYLWFFVWNPPIFITMINERNIDETLLLQVATLVVSIYLGLLLVSAARAFRRYSRIFQDTQAGMKSISPSPEP